MLFKVIAELVTEVPIIEVCKDVPFPRELN